MIHEKFIVLSQQLYGDIISYYYYIMYDWLRKKIIKNIGKLESPGWKYSDSIRWIRFVLCYFCAANLMNLRAKAKRRQDRGKRLATVLGVYQLLK